MRRDELGQGASLSCPSRSPTSQGRGGEPLGHQQFPQPGHLLLQLPDQPGIRVLIDDGIAANLLGAVGVPG